MDEAIANRNQLVTETPVRMEGKEQKVEHNEEKGEFFDPQPTVQSGHSVQSVIQAVDETMETIESLPGFQTLIDDLLDKRERRSEEHTSELQSRGHIVCRLLLEKKKTRKKTKL